MIPATPARRTGSLRQRLGLPCPPQRPAETPDPRPVDKPEPPVWLQRSRAGIQIPKGVDRSSLP
jgi:hypothetical protein